MSSYRNDWYSDQGLGLLRTTNQINRGKVKETEKERGRGEEVGGRRKKKRDGDGDGDGEAGGE